MDIAIWRHVCIWMLAVSVLAVSPLLQAAAPEILSYQGYVEESGNPVTGNRNIVFTIYDAPVGGTIIWQESHTAVSISGGLFTALIGAGNHVSYGPLQPFHFSDSLRFLGVTVGAYGINPEISPRTRLASSPYAFRVSTLDGSTGGTVSGTIELVDGNIVLDPSTSSTGVVYKNGLPFIHNYGAFNTCLGVNAGNLAMGGGFNTGTGSGALAANTTGAGNTAIGASALATNTVGSSNTACGRSALASNNSGNNNTAVGQNAMVSNNSGSNNSAVGSLALSANTSGNSNTAFGASALYTNTTGATNTALGSSALHDNISGSLNTATGGSALASNTIGSGNTASGYHSLGMNTSGNSNTATGADALRSNTTGSQNTAAGEHSLYNNTTGASLTGVGFNSLRDNSSGFNNTAGGAYALLLNTTGANNVAFGVNSLQTNTIGTQNTAIGYAADVSAGNFTNATAIGAGAIANASNKIRIGNAAVTVIEGQVAYTFTSDVNSKENFLDLDGEKVLEKIGRLHLSSWNYKEQDSEKFRHYGPMAQEVFKEFGFDGIGVSGTPTTINSGDLMGIMLAALQALEKRTQEYDKLAAEHQSVLSSLQILQTEILELKETLRAK